MSVIGQFKNVPFNIKTIQFWLGFLGEKERFIIFFHISDRQCSIVRMGTSSNCGWGECVRKNSKGAATLPVNVHRWIKQRMDERHNETTEALEQKVKKAAMGCYQCGGTPPTLKKLFPFRLQFSPPIVEQMFAEWKSSKYTVPVWGGPLHNYFFPQTFRLWCFNDH